ncbi:hypothetical protein SAMN05444156_0684 [Verrucomicrobium sp. GAS474]|uniref:hypothetical protein n=1 Tax=Verrucomicrobium sp. GAS474 TaxID=1882831 RepID=UPI00087941BA|nr:hypothetical protein [Verrucomicrobium sp. GAS474]SDT91331.1 hypothetical protein SAMN05444156_0684 [Verrucomicrobium sp. GAS474]
MLLPSEWNIQSPAHACAATGKPFAEGDKVVTVLLQDRKGEWKRLDYAAGEWPIPTQGNLINPLDEKGMELLSSWRSLYKPRPQAATALHGINETLTKDNAESLLRRLLSERNPAHNNACYILALMLERKRMLKELDRREIEGIPCLIYEHTPSGETWIIPNPPMRLDEMTRVQTEVMNLLAGPAPAPAVEVPAEIPAETPAEAVAAEETPLPATEAAETPETLAASDAEGNPSSDRAEDEEVSSHPLA